MSVRQTGGSSPSIIRALWSVFIRQGFMAACEETAGPPSSPRNPLFHQSAQHHVAIRSKAGEETVPHWILYSTSQHSTTWRSGLKLVRKQFGTESSIPPVSTAPHGIAVGSIAFDKKEVGLRAQHGTLCSTSQLSTTNTWQSDRKLLRKQALELNTEPSVPPVNTAPHSSQMKSLWRNVRA